MASLKRYCIRQSSKKFLFPITDVLEGRAKSKKVYGNMAKDQYEAAEMMEGKV